MKKFLIVSLVLLSACSTAPAATPTEVGYNSPAMGGTATAGHVATSTSTPIPTVVPTATSTPWLYPTPLYDPALDGSPYGLPERVADNAEAWSDNVEVYVMLGSDYASWRTNLVTGTDNTDAFVIVIISKEPATVSMIAVPRDLYVFQPGFGMQRINTAWKHGGAKMVADTLRYNFGLPMNGYAYVRMEAFSRFVDDALHGIDVEVRNPVIDNCSDIVINLLPGKHFMDGPTATCYSRIRVFDGGFKRQSRQIEVLLAMKNKFFEIAGDSPLKLLGEIFKLYVNEHRYTDVSVLDVTRLFPVALEANENDRVLEYQINYDVGIEHFTHPVSGAWLLAPPDANCVYNLVARAVLGESWENLPDGCDPK